jgi:hypothetical protein
MSIEVVIPSLRQEPVERLIASLSLQTHPPDAITIVSNETQPFGVDGLPVRLLRFSSHAYAIGEKDVALRQNVGIYSSGCDYIVISGDDQVAPPTMIEDTLAALEIRKRKVGFDYIWGNHRLTDFLGKSLDDIRLADRESGLSREFPVPPHGHGYWSCYGGMFAARTDFIQEFGAFDMAFIGRHANEDQQLGYRLMKRAGHQAVFILEPPFSWHSMELRVPEHATDLPWMKPVLNGCGPGNHDLGDAWVKGLLFDSCMKCPFTSYKGGHVALVERDDVAIRYRPEWVETTSIWLNERENI